MSEEKHAEGKEVKAEVKTKVKPAAKKTSFGGVMYRGADGKLTRDAPKKAGK